MPSEPDTVVRGAGRMLDFASTVTPGSTPPLASVTLPLIEPVCCASAGSAASVEIKNRNVQARARSIHPPPESRLETAMVSRGGVGVDRGAEQPGFSVQDDRDGNRGDERRQGFLGVEGVDEQAGGECRQNFRRDAAADVDAGRGDGAQREIAGFGAVRGNEQVERLDALWAALLERGAADRRRQVRRILDGANAHARARRYQ